MKSALLDRRDAIQIDALWDDIIAQLTTWTNWLSTNGVAGVIEEWGLPYAPTASDLLKWNLLGELYLRRLDQLNLPATMWGSGTVFAPPYPLLVYGSTSGLLGTINIRGPNAAPAENHWTGANGLRGVCVSGADSNTETGTNHSSMAIAGGGVFSNYNPGVSGTDYVYPSLTSLQYLAARGVKLIRLMVRWERLQPTLGAALSSSEVSRVQTVLTNAATVGLKVVICPWNNGGYISGATTTIVSWNQLTLVDPTRPVTAALFQNFWTLMATAFNSYSALWGYSLMNEPGMDTEYITTGSNLVGSNAHNGSTTGWTANSYCTIAQDTTNYRWDSTGSIKLTANGNGTPTMSSVLYAVSPGDTYIARAWATATTPTNNGESVTAGINYFNSSYSYIGQTFSGNYPYDSSWTELVTNFTPPADCAYVQFDVGGVSTWAANEAHDFTDFSIYQTTGTNTGQQILETCTQDAVTGIRSVDTTHEIWVPGFYGQTPENWVSGTHSTPTPWITDPNNNFRYAAHHYFDVAEGSPGNYSSPYATELAFAVSAGY